MTPNDHMPTVAIDLIGQGKRVALATVISTWGSAPRPIGSQLAITEGGEFWGSVSGGCVEGAVILEAQSALQDGKCRILEYGVADEDAFAVGLACGGEIRILVEPIDIGDGPKLDQVSEITQAHKDRKTIALSVDLATWERNFITPISDTSYMVDDIFTAVHAPSLQLAIVGAVHITQVLAPIARMAGYSVLLIDPREGFATQTRFPDDTFVDAWPDEAMDQIGLDDRTGVITLSHDPKMDNPALERAIQSDAFYIGALGSKRTHAKRCAHLEQAGFNIQQIARIHAPIGVDIGSKSPAEIAISVMAELTERLRRPETRR
jgi:xanthine dehydrogenase accessory factor